MSVQQWQLLVDAVFGIFVVTIVMIALLVTASRPARDREALLRGVPPSGTPLHEREAALLTNARTQARRQALVMGPAIAAVLALISVVTLAVHGGFSRVGFVAAGLIIVAYTLSWEIFAAAHLSARYRGAKRRLSMEANSWSDESGRPLNRSSDST